MPTDIFS